MAWNVITVDIVILKEGLRSVKVSALKGNGHFSLVSSSCCCSCTSWTLEGLNGWLLFWLESKLCEYSLMVRTDTGTEGKRGTINQNISQLPCSFHSCRFCFPTQNSLFFSLSLNDGSHCLQLAPQHQGEEKRSNLFLFCFYLCFTWMISELILEKSCRQWWE